MQTGERKGDRGTGPAIIRANLREVCRTLNGKPYWVARGTVPVRCPETGRVTAERRERSLTGHSPAARRAEVAALNSAFEAEAAHAAAPITFAKALKNYVETGGPVPIYAERMLELIGPRRCRDLTDSDLIEARTAIFRPGAAPSYVNRHLYTPVIAVLAQALKQDAPRLTRPRGHKQRSENTFIAVPPREWYGAIVPHLGPGDAALIYFLAAHGRRLSDGLRRAPADFDPVQGTLAIGRTKNGEPLLIELAPAVAARIAALPRTGKFLFGDGNRSRFRDRIKAACRAAGVDYFTPHEFGRHAFATRLLRQGASLEHVRKAGGWKSIEIVSRLYAHLSRSDTRETIEQASADLFLASAGENAGKAITLIPNAEQSTD